LQLLLFSDEGNVEDAVILDLRPAAQREQPGITSSAAEEGLDEAGAALGQPAHTIAAGVHGEQDRLHRSRNRRRQLNSAHQFAGQHRRFARPTGAGIDNHRAGVGDDRQFKVQACGDARRRGERASGGVGEQSAGSDQIVNHAERPVAEGPVRAQQCSIQIRDEQRPRCTRSQRRHGATVSTSNSSASSVPEGRGLPAAEGARHLG
jgi:hypothetical protein